MNAKRRSGFERGTGSYACTCCGRLTRATGVQSVGSMLCPDCYELAGIYNLLQDEGQEGIQEYVDEIRERCANIEAKGGKLDGDARELLAAIGGAA